MSKMKSILAIAAGMAAIAGPHHGGSLYYDTPSRKKENKHVSKENIKEPDFDGFFKALWQYNVKYSNRKTFEIGDHEIQGTSLKNAYQALNRLKKEYHIPTNESEGRL
jgi:hypothetical protein